jgi:hypothetical protein
MQSLVCGLVKIEINFKNIQKKKKEILNRQKCLFSKMEGRTINRSCQGVSTSGSGEDIRKG